MPMQLVCCLTGIDVQLQLQGGAPHPSLDRTSTNGTQLSRQQWINAGARYNRPMTLVSSKLKLSVLFLLVFHWFSLIFPWFFICFSLDLPWFSLVFHLFSFVFLGFSLVFPLFFLCFSLVFPWVFLGFSLGFPW